MINTGEWSTLRLLAAALLSLFVGVSAQAQETASAGPGEMIAGATDRIMALVADANSYFDEEPQRYYDAVGTELDGLVDFRSFARGVMGDVASGATYRKLDDAGKQRLRTQLDAFTAVIRTGLIQTYGKGLLAFGGSETKVAEAVISPDNARVASVTQSVMGDEDKVYTLRYQMGLYRDGSWKLRNMIIENVNLGEIYRSQFADALDAAGGDVDKVIAEWNTDTVAAE